MATLDNQWQQYVITRGGISLTLLASGDVFKWQHGDHQINLVQGNLIDGMMANLYLRAHTATGYQFTKLLGVHSPSRWALTEDGAVYEGQWQGVTYRVRLVVAGDQWWYQLTLTGHPSDVHYDVFYGQDLGIAHPFGILSNEAYTSQYIDHQVFPSQHGFTLLSRQNQGLTHYVQLGCDVPTIGYSTDAMQFFGLDYKRDHQPMALQQPRLENRNYQYEFAYPTLQTKSFTLTNNPTIITFYGLSYQANQALLKEPLPHQPFPVSTVASNLTWHEPVKVPFSPTQPISGRPLSLATLQQRFPSMATIETQDGQCLSAFLPNHDHLVTMQKELLVERMHGHILLSGDVLHASEDVFATTAYMTGIFGSHTVYGNTNFHKLTGDLRHPLNAHTISGNRLWLKVDDTYRLLAMPSYVVMGLTAFTWVYELEDDTLTITLTVDGTTPGSRLTFTSAQARPYDLYLAQQWLLDTNEYQHRIHYDQQGQSLVIHGRSSGMIQGQYPHLQYRQTLDQPFVIKRLPELSEGVGQDGGLIYLHLTSVHTFTLITDATLNETFSLRPSEIAQGDTYTALVQSLIPLNIESQDQYASHWQAMGHIIPWYVHDALVHYASPHGLEQYNGAAWGTRDVLQGPFELFLTAQRFDINREILLKIFARQFMDSKEFPQWFMFDRYRHIQAHESHGDVLVWPLKALANYLEATNDLQILSERLPYMDKHKGQFTQELVPVSEHVWAIIATIQASVIPGTHLPAYGGGDWDDTLQPANHDLTKQMVSGWTVALLIEALTLLSQYPLFEEKRMQQLRSYIQGLTQDYQSYLIVDNIPAGFVIFYPGHQEVLLHPRDHTTGLSYRLLPFNRGMIAQLFDPAQVAMYQPLIKEHLRHPDGVRLMNTAVTYQGGKKTYFQRAETAANFGREIGIQYVHAHIRYIEAMTVIGNAEEAWWALNVIHPIVMNQFVPNASLRQRNVYFSSSDAAFYDRYEAKKDFDKVRQGKVAVKAGWRLYSSGPGIYLGTWIRKFLGIQVRHGALHLDPQPAQSLMNATIHYRWQGQPLTISLQGKPTTMASTNRYRGKLNFEITKTSSGIHAKLKA